MARAKVKLAFIEDLTARKATYKKRVRGIIKKGNEFSVLCGIDTAAVVYINYESGPVAFPSSADGVRQILMRYKESTEMDQAEKKLNHAEFLQQTITKLTGNMERLDIRYKELEMEDLMCDLLNGKPIEQVPYHDFGFLIWVIQERLRSVNLRILNGNGPLNAADAAVNPAQNLHISSLGESGNLP